jgi:hypothetical protein
LAYDANIRIGVTGLDQLNKAIGAVNKLEKQLARRFEAALDTQQFDRLGVTLDRVAQAAGRARANLNNVDVNNWAELRGAVKRVVDTLELQEGVQRKINKELDIEIAKRNQLKTAVQANIAASRQSREASNFGFGNAGDPVAKSIARNQAKVAAATAPGEAVLAMNRLNEKEKQYFVEVQRANEALYLRSEIIKRLAQDQYARDRAVSQDFGVNPARALRPAGVSDADVARRNADAARGRQANAEEENLSAVERRIGLRNQETEIMNRQTALLKQQAIDEYARNKSLSRNFGVKDPARALRPAGVSDEQVIARNAEATRAKTLKDRKEAFQIANREEQAELRINKVLERRQQLAAGIKDKRAGAGNLRQGAQGALIGGGFPLLFGQGAGASVGGLLGGGIGGAGFAGGAFAGGIAGSLLGTQFDKLKASALGLADALKAPSEALAAMEASGIKVSGALKNTVDALESTGRAAEAQALVFAELERLGGASYVQNLLELEEANKALQEEWSKLSVQVQNELLPAFITLTETFTALAKVLRESQIVDIITRVASVINGIPRVGAELLQGKGLGQALAIGGNQVASAFNQDQKTQRERQPGPVDDTRQRKALDEAIARQKEVLDLQRRGEDLDRANSEFARDQAEKIFDLRKRAADYDREVARFRRDIEDKIADKQEENARTLAELTRQRRQNVIEQLDQTLEPAGQISALQGGGRAASVDLAREYIRTIAEGQADLQEKEAKAKLDIAKVQRDADRFSLDVADKVKDFSDKAADYAKEVEKFKYETAKKVVDLQRQAADYTYAQWERVYKLAATVAEKSAAAADQGVSEPASNFTSNASRGKALIGIGKRLGISPLDLALVIQAESGGNPGIVGGAGGNYQGLIQFGPSERRQYGYRRGMGFEEQLGPGGPVENYLKDRFRGAGRSTQGASLLDLYTTVLAGNPGANPDSRDSFGNSARSQVTKIQRERESVRQRYFTTSGPLSVGPTAATAPVSFPSAASVAGSAPKAPSALPLTGVPSSLARPDVSKLLGQYKDLNAESVRYLQDLQQTAREAAKLSEIAAKTKLDRANAALSQQFLQPLLDANQALEDRAAYEREYGDLLKNGALPALAEQLATADQLEKTQLRLLELEQSATQEAIKQTEAQLARTDITVEQRKEQEKILAILQGQAAVLDQTRGTIIQQSDQQRGQIQAAESPEARRQRAINRYTERANERNDPNRRLETFLEAKSNLEDLTDPTNQIISAANGIGDAFGNAFKDVASGSKSAQEALSDMFTNIGASFLDMAAQILAQQLVLSILGAFGFGGGGGAGNLFGNNNILNSGIGAGFGASFAGGGYTGSGSRSGGIDGQGGFPAILHPQETVVDHTTARPQLKPSGQMMADGSASSEITYSGPVLRFNEQDYVSKGDIPRIVRASVVATGREMRASVPFRRRAGV